MLIDIYMKFREDSLNGFKVKKRTRVETESKGNHPKSTNTRVMVLALCTSSNVD